MDRRRFVAGVAVVTGLTGCMDADETSPDDETTTPSGDHREVRIEAENLTREADNRIVENGQVSVVLRLRNIGAEPTYAEVVLQMRDRDGEDLGSPYTRKEGPIESGVAAELRFDVDESDENVGGYELVVRETDPTDANATG